MNRIIASLVALLVAGSSSAQTIGVIAPKIPGGAPALIVPGSPAIGVGLSAPVLTPLSLTPALSAAAIAATPVPVLIPIAALVPAPPIPFAVQSVPAALRAATALSGTLSAAASEGRSQAPALNGAFDGLKAASKSDDDGVVQAPVDSSFVLEAQRRFSALRRSEDSRSRSAVLPEGVIPSDEDLQGRMDRIPSTNPERAKFMIELFKLGGATDADIVLQDAGRGRNNIIVTKKGKTDRVVVVGAHYDKVSAGLGKIDNGTGSTLVANLYQALNGIESDATIVFIAFAREEEGLIGSKTYVKSLDKAARGKIDAMINLDTLAVDGTFSWKNNSTRAVLDRLAEVSRASGHALKEDYLNGGDADSSSFRDAGIPAVTIYGASQDVIFDIIHSENDNMSAFSLKHYKNAYMLVLEAIKSLDRTPLGPVGRGSI